MLQSAVTVRYVLGWSLRLVHQAESADVRVPSPRLAQMTLERMLSSSDSDTAADIIADYCDGVETRDEVLETLLDMRSRRPARRRREFPGLDVARASIARMQAYHRGEERRLLEQGSTMTWRQLEAHWPGRVWQSLQDDYERLADRLYCREKVFICQASEFIVKEGTMRDSIRG